MWTYKAHNVNTEAESEVEVHRSSVEAEHRPNIRPKAQFGSATLQHSAELRPNFGNYSVKVLHSGLLSNAPCSECCTQFIVLQSPINMCPGVNAALYSYFPVSSLLKVFVFQIGVPEPSGYAYDISMVRPIVRENVCNEAKKRSLKVTFFWILKKRKNIFKNIKVITCKVLRTTQSVFFCKY